MKHEFGEKKTERVNGIDVGVIETEKFIASRKKAIEMIESNKYGLEDADFWILMNLSKNKGWMLYSGLIISHNGCLKINDSLDDELKFKEEYCSNPVIDANGMYMIYRDKRDGLLEYGEISKDNCKNAYPYAMLLKRTFDRVVLKKSKLAYYGVYSDSEADEFKEPKSDTKEQTSVENSPMLLTCEMIDEFHEKYTEAEIKTILEHYNCEVVDTMDAGVIQKYLDLRKNNEKVNY